MIKIIVFCATIIFNSTCQSQNKYQLRSIAFYNLENLFDTIDDPDKLDEHSPMLSIPKNKRGLAYKGKINALAEVIAKLKPSILRDLPSIIGLAEVENSKVLRDILNNKKLNSYGYKIIHEEGPDLRGIDVAFIYQPNHFKPNAFQLIPVKLWDNKGKRIYTRSLLLITGYFENKLVAFIVCHWPSRRGGQSKSNILRKRAAYRTKQVVDSLSEFHKKIPIIVMGDFNDNPTDDSFKEVLKTQSDLNKCNDTLLYNPFEKLFLKGYASLGFRDEGHLFDQILLNKHWFKKHENEFFFIRSGIFNPPFLTLQKGKFKGYPYRSFSKNGFTGGYSDHYPVYILLAKRVYSLNSE